MDRVLASGHRNVQLRAKIILLWLRGTSARSISHQTGASLTTVYRWIHRWQERPYSSIFKHTSPVRQRDYVMQEARDRRQETGDSRRQETGDRRQETGDSRRQETGDSRRQETGDSRRQETGDSRRQDTGDSRRQETGDSRRQETGDSRRQETGDSRKQPREVKDMKHLTLNLVAVLVMMATLITAGQKEELHNDDNKVGDMILQLVKHYFLDCHIILQTTTTTSHSPVLSPLIRWAGLGLVQLSTSNDSIIPFEMWQDRRTTCSVVILHLDNNNFNNSSNSAFR
ncbi:hypothetical protein Pcinc_034445 [Petrolisthes cinctipes]|uniref:Uncharacterized protein n=1 Tax=Petrolisthes cinctipes TaxID=88211 RepID=A0AAE1JVL7_PETCI|nr:hypothetical protein Pcinc_034445 [Petrolisthes cinctipes]